MRRGLIISLFFYLLTMVDASAQRPSNVSPYVGDVIDRATAFMSQSSYDSAGYILNEAFSQTDVAYTSRELYFLLSYEAENMYYNALFDLGLNSAMRGLELAAEMKNDTLIGNSENIVGLFLMSMGKYDEALEHFRRAIMLIKPHTLAFLTYHYQALLNAAECFLKLTMPDSTFQYAQRGVTEAERLQNTRGQTIIDWTMAEAWLQKNMYDSAYVALSRGLSRIQDSQHRDLVLTLYTTFMRLAASKNESTELFMWMDRGLNELKNPLNTDYARSVFLEEATDLCIQMNELKKGAELMRSWKKLQKNLVEKQQNQRIEIVKDYFEKNQRLVLAKEEDRAQKEQLALRNSLAVILGVLSVVLVILIAVALVYFRQRQRIARLEYKEQLRKNEIDFELKSLENRMAAVSAERDRIASDLHDDIGASLSSIRIYSGAAQKRFQSEPEEALRLIDRINEGSAGMMDRMSDIVWSINPKNDNVESIVFRMKSHAGEILSPLNIEVDYKVDKEAELIQPSMTARRNIYLIFKEGINNVAKYSGARHVHIELIAQHGVLRLVLKDDGVGFDTANHKPGNGLSTMRRRAESLGGSFMMHAALGEGTCITIEFQIARISDGVYR